MKKDNSTDMSVSYLKDINHKESEKETHSSNGSLHDFLGVQNWTMVKPRIDPRGILRSWALSIPFLNQWDMYLLMS